MAIHDYVTQTICRVFPPLAMNTTCQITLQAIRKSVPDEMTKPIYTRFTQQLDGAVHSLVHLVSGRAAVVRAGNEDDDDESVFFICQEEDINALKASSFVDTFYSLPRDSARRNCLEKAREHAINAEWRECVDDQFNAQHAFLITIRIEKTSKYEGMYWIDKDKEGGTRVPLARTRNRAEPELSTLRGINTWLRVHTPSVATQIQLQSEFFTKILFSNKDRSAYPHIRFREVFAPTSPTLHLLREFQTHSRSFIIVVDVDDINYALMSLFLLLKSTAGSTFKVLVIAHIEDNFFKYAESFFQFQELPNVTIDVHPSLPWIHISDGSAATTSVSNDSAVFVDHSLFSPIQIDHTVSPEQLQKRARAWLSYSDPNAMSWELVASRYVVQTRQAKAIVRTIIKLKHNQLGLVKHLRGSGASALLRCVGYELKCLFRVYNVIAVPSTDSLIQLLGGATDKILLLCDENVSHVETQQSLAQLPAHLSSNISLLYVRSKLAAPLTPTEVPVNPFLAISDAQVFCNQLGHCFKDSRKALN
ncbi:MAG: hypothetical protein K2Q09_05605, partial [Phycisphaerales bacterium]|nr:hypothetical protein [Phycisphaerales bacterium]